MQGWILGLALIATGLGAIPAQAAADGALGVVVRPDPAVRRGVLPNGLRYVLEQNATAPGLSLRLGFDVGSYEEHDDELGYAHFVEHMAFNGTRNFPEGRLDQAFAPLGVAFGRDQNAFTGLYATTYHLDLPRSGAAQVDTGLRWLRDIADGLLFEARAVARERGVVLAERNAHNGAGERLKVAMEQFQAAGLRSAVRQPIGTEASISSAAPDGLRRFYDSWYQPANAVVVMVGDLPVETMERRVQDTFADWSPRGPAGVRPSPGAAPMRGLEARVWTETHAAPLAMACRRAAPDHRDINDPEVFRDSMLAVVAQEILNRRLTALTGGASPPFLSAAVDNDGDRREGDLQCLGVTPINGDWRRALGAAQGELTRFTAEGPTEEEMESSLSVQRANLRGAITAAPGLARDGRADGLLSAALKGRVTAAPREVMRAFGIVAESMTAAQVQLAFSRTWSGGDPILSLVSPKAETAEALTAAWLAPAPANASAPAAPALSWNYGAPAPPGRVVRRQVVEPLGFARLVFKNGVVLNVKRSVASKGEVGVEVRFGHGGRAISEADYPAAVVAAAMLAVGGLGRNSYEELQSLFRNWEWSVDLSIERDAFLLSGETFPDALPIQLNLLAAYLSDPGFRPALDARMPSHLEAVHRTSAREPNMVVRAARETLMGARRPTTPPPQEMLTRLTAADLGRVLRPVLAAGPLEVTIVGDVDEAAAVDAVSRSFGALPPRGAAAPVRPAAGGRFPAERSQPIRVTHDGGPSRALAGLYWPLAASRPDNLRDDYVLMLLAGVLETELRRQLREDMGKSYAPQGDARSDMGDDQGFLSAWVETTPADLEAITQATRATAARLAGGEITEEALEEVRNPMLAKLDAPADRGWLMKAISGSARDPKILRDALQQAELTRNITLSEVRAAAAKWLAQAPLVILASPSNNPEVATR